MKNKCSDGIRIEDKKANRVNDENSLTFFSWIYFIMSQQIIKIRKIERDNQENLMFWYFNIFFFRNQIY